MQRSILIPHDLAGFLASDNPVKTFLNTPFQHIQTSAVFEHLTQRELNDIMRQALGSLSQSLRLGARQLPEALNVTLTNAYENRGREHGIPRSDESKKDIQRLLQTFTPVLERLQEQADAATVLGLSLAFGMCSESDHPELIRQETAHQYTNGRNPMQDASFMAHAILEGVARAGRMMCIETLEYALAGGSVHVSAPPLAANQQTLSAARIVLAPAEEAYVAVALAHPGFQENGNVNTQSMSRLITSDALYTPDSVLVLLLERNYAFAFASGGAVDIDLVLPGEYRNIKRGLSLDPSGSGVLGPYSCEWEQAERGDLTLRFRGVEPHIFLAAAADAFWDKLPQLNHVRQIADIQEQLSRQHGV